MFQVSLWSLMQFDVTKYDKYARRSEKQVESNTGIIKTVRRFYRLVSCPLILAHSCTVGS